MNSPLSLRANPSVLAPGTRVSTLLGPGTVIRDDNHAEPAWVRCDRVWVLLDAGANPQWFRGRDLQETA